MKLIDRSESGLIRKKQLKDDRKKRKFNELAVLPEKSLEVQLKRIYIKYILYSYGYNNSSSVIVNDFIDKIIIFDMKCIINSGLLVDRLFKQKVGTVEMQQLSFILLGCLVLIHKHEYDYSEGNQELIKSFNIPILDLSIIEKKLLKKLNYNLSVSEKDTIHEYNYLKELTGGLDEGGLERLFDEEEGLIDKN